MGGGKNDGLTLQCHLKWIADRDGQWMDGWVCFIIFSRTQGTLSQFRKNAKLICRKLQRAEVQLGYELELQTKSSWRFVWSSTVNCILKLRKVAAARWAGACLVRWRASWHVASTWRSTCPRATCGRRGSRPAWTWASSTWWATTGPSSPWPPWATCPTPPPKSSTSMWYFSC